ncbi:hypothetical protein GPECTOR_56g413 [Gonium pectorale]|uniref:Uncharacterized protein n=1 Tax=Gonium pectorale TaxID=33097 RepID=A0A150G601_GONPE|nr:hypothetical protein GPECTOR_56g413 [Gonium pectorale]|eukprot:KXZ45316.1 hypothetical protein GPECTOR_56g413 [Gonium pectorale]
MGPGTSLAVSIALKQDPGALAKNLLRAVHKEVESSQRAAIALSAKTKDILDDTSLFLQHLNIEDVSHSEGLKLVQAAKEHLTKHGVLGEDAGPSWNPAINLLKWSSDQAPSSSSVLPDDQVIPSLFVMATGSLHSVLELDIADLTEEGGTSILRLVEIKASLSEALAAKQQLENALKVLTYAYRLTSPVAQLKVEAAVCGARDSESLNKLTADFAKPWDAAITGDKRVSIATTVHTFGAEGHLEALVRSATPVEAASSMPCV